jgi:uncharacterized membrane protein YoaK (UPF0700 family)
MLSARAYSMRQKSRLAISLSWIAGFTNAIALLGLGTVVSHVTGTSTNFAKSIGAGEWRDAGFFGYLLLTFVAGSALSAVMTETARRRGWRSKYILPIAVEAALLALIAFHLARHPLADPRFPDMLAGVASLAMGLQNATITQISGAVVRTTHLTGIFTDLGIETVQYFFWYKDRMAQRRWERAGRLLRISFRHPSFLRLALLLSIAGSFGFGAVLGTIALLNWSGVALIIPVAFLLWIVYVDLTSPIADIREMDLLNDPELKLHNLVNHLLPREVVLYRMSGALTQRAPNFAAWIDRLPAHCRVIIMAFSPLTRFNANAALDLQAAVVSLRQSGRDLIISGITTAGVIRLMDVNNVCPDLEFAIARAVAIFSEMRPENSEDDSPELFDNEVALRPHL